MDNVLSHYQTAMAGWQVAMKGNCPQLPSCPPKIFHNFFVKCANNNIVICKAHKVSGNAESEAPAVAWWAALVGYVKRNVLRQRLKVSAVGESLVSRGKSFQTVGAR